MSMPTFNAATHISIVWGVTLAIVTLLEWHGLERDPLRKQIISPFIQRDIAVVALEPDPFESSAPGDSAQAAEQPNAVLQYEVEFHFEGLLFLLYFFLPVLLFHAGGWLIARARATGASK